MERHAKVKELATKISKEREELHDFSMYVHGNNRFCAVLTRCQTSRKNTLRVNMMKEYQEGNLQYVKNDSVDDLFL